MAKLYQKEESAPISEQKKYNATSGKATGSTRSGKSANNDAIKIYAPSVERNAQSQGGISSRPETRNEQILGEMLIKGGTAK